MNAPTVGRRTVPTDLTMAECLGLLRSERVGRICLDLDGYPVALPVNYVVDDTIDGARIVVLTAPRTVIGRYNGRASLEVDRFDLERGQAWSVIVRGELSLLAGRKPNESPRPFVSDRRTHWMELTIVALSGRTFGAGQAGLAVDWQLAPVPSPRR